jgi:hypothetical protein
MPTNLAVEVDPLPADGACTLDAVLPSQLYGSAANAGLVPEKRLMLAVLEEAVFTFQRDALTTRRGRCDEIHEVEAWFAADDPEWPFSFVNICAALEIEPTFLRHGLADWLRRRAALPEVERRPIRNPFRRMNGSRHRPGGRSPKLEPRLEVVR